VMARQYSTAVGPWRAYLSILRAQPPDTAVHPSAETLMDRSRG